MSHSPITKYVVRRPGCNAWSEHKTERAARRERANADRICCPGHVVYAYYASGMNGPALPRGK
jgi:hypothetical protein